MFASALSCLNIRILDSFPHGSAQNINIITREDCVLLSICAYIDPFCIEFICDSLTNTCKANQAAKNLCTTAQAAASSAKAGTGAQADAFNSAFGIQTVSLRESSTPTLTDSINSILELC